MRVRARGNGDINNIEAATAGYTQAFIAFWNTYPATSSRVGRSDAWVKWCELELDAQAAQVMKALAAFKATPNWQAGKYISKPVNWLNDEPWLSPLPENPDQQEKPLGDW